MDMMSQVSASMGKKSVVGPSRLPDGVAASDVLGRIQQAFDLTIRPEEGRALEGDGAVHDLARIMAKDLGYDLRVRLVKKSWHSRLTFR